MKQWSPVYFRLLSSWVYLFSGLLSVFPIRTGVPHQGRSLRLSCPSSTVAVLKYVHRFSDTPLFKRWSLIPLALGVTFYEWNMAEMMVCDSKAPLQKTLWLPPYFLLHHLVWGHQLSWWGNTQSSPMDGSTWWMTRASCQQPSKTKAFCQELYEWAILKRI